jgi:carbonic anhydrase/acetyltransferase-like protein (isoleucine patch superfamily)
MAMRRLMAVLMIVLPQSLKRRVGRVLFGWDIHPTAYLGPSLIIASKLTMGPRASIGWLNVIRGLEELRLDEDAQIGGRNWVYGFPKEGFEPFEHLSNRRSALILGKRAEITIGHKIDCSDRVELRDFAVVAGFESTLLTHSVDLVRDRHVTRPLEIGMHSVVMTDCILLNGAHVPDFCIISAGSVVNTRLKQEYTFYRGNPAEPVRELPPTLGFFRRGDPEPQGVSTDPQLDEELRQASLRP